MTKSRAIISEIDGVIPDYPDDFIKREIIPNEAIPILIQMFTHKWPTGSYRLIFVTSRPEKERKKTLKWLVKKYNWQQDKEPLWHSFILFMRPDFLPEPEGLKIAENYRLYPDHRPSAEIKREIYLKEIKDKYDILFCLEDDEKCAEMYRELGLTVLRVMK